MKSDPIQLTKYTKIIEFMNFMALALSDAAPIVPRNLLPETVGSMTDIVMAKIKLASANSNDHTALRLAKSHLPTCAQNFPRNSMIQRSTQAQAYHLLLEECKILRYREGYNLDNLINLTRLDYSDLYQENIYIFRFMAHEARSCDKSFGFLEQFLGGVNERASLYAQNKFRQFSDVEITFVGERKFLSAQK